MEEKILFILESRRISRKEGLIMDGFEVLGRH